MKRMFLIVIMILCFSPLVFGLPGVKSWKAVWDANTESDLAGYYLYWRVDSEAFDNSRRIDCGLVTEYSLDSIPTNTFLALTAYDTSSNESEFSGEVPFFQDQVAPDVVDGLSIVAE